MPNTSSFILVVFSSFRLAVCPFLDMRINGKRQRKSLVNFAIFTGRGGRRHQVVCGVAKEHAITTNVYLVLHYGYIWGPSRLSPSKIFGFAFFRIQLKTAVRTTTTHDDNQQSTIVLPFQLATLVFPHFPQRTAQRWPRNGERISR